MRGLYENGMSWADSDTRHHHQQARATGRLYLEDHNTEDDLVSPIQDLLN